MNARQRQDNIGEENPILDRKGEGGRKGAIVLEFRATNTLLSSQAFEAGNQIFKVEAVCL